MKALRVGEDFYLNADSVDAIQRYGTRPAMRELKRAREAGTLHNASRGKEARSLISLRSGWVVISTYAPNTLVSRPLVLPPTRPRFRSAERAHWDDDFLSEGEPRTEGMK